MSTGAGGRMQGPTGGPYPRGERPTGGPQPAGHSSTTPRAPTTALSRLALVLVVIVVVAALAELSAAVFPYLITSDIAYVIALLVTLVIAVCSVALLGVGIACLIVGILAYTRLGKGRARTGALLIVIAAVIATLVMTSGFTGDALPQAAYVVMEVVRGLSAVAILVLSIVGMMMLRGDRAGVGR